MGFEWKMVSFMVFSLAIMNWVRWIYVGHYSTPASRTLTRKYKRICDIMMWCGFAYHPFSDTYTKGMWMVKMRGDIFYLYMRKREFHHIHLLHINYDKFRIFCSNINKEL